MPPSPLTALSPLDGRYHNKLSPLRDNFSELALIRFRVLVEVEWLKALAREQAITEVRAFSPTAISALSALVTDFSEAEGAAVKAIEGRINHDVKAVEYFMRDKLAANLEIMKAAEFIHFACTSEDVNNLAHALMLKRSRDEVMLPALDALISKLSGMARELADAAMPARRLPRREDHTTALP